MYRSLLICFIASILGFTACDLFEPYPIIPSELDSVPADTTLRLPIVYYRNYVEQSAINEGKGSDRDAFNRFTILTDPRNGNQFLRGEENDDFLGHNYLRLDTLEAFTFSVWSRGPSGQSEVYLSKLDSMGNFNGQLAIKEDRLRTDFRGFTNSNRITDRVLDNQWNMLTVTADNANTDLENSTITIYTDGVVFQEFSGRKVFFTGGRNYNFLSNIRNDIDEILFYDRTLTAEEVDSIFLATKDIFKPTVTPDPTEKHLFAYYPFDAQNATDVSGGRSGTSTAINFTQTGVGGRGHCATFDSLNPGVIEIANPILSEICEFTLSYWVKINSPRYNPVLYQGRGQAMNNNQALAWLQTGEIFLGDDDVSEFDYDASAELFSGDWTMITISCTRINTQAPEQPASLYINGEKVRDTMLTDIDFERFAPLLIGSDGSGTSFAGQIDNLRFYNLALNAEAIRTLYQLEK